MARVLVACLGSGFAGDRGAGCAVHAFLSGSALPEGGRLLLVRPGPLHLLHALDGCEALIAVGEVDMGARPGTVHVLDWNEVPLGGDAETRRGNSLRVTMEAARIRDPARAPRRAFLVGIEGHGDDGQEGGLHAEAAAALAGAARVALDLAHGLAGMEDDGLLDVEQIARGDDAVTPRASASRPRPPAAVR
jgi:hydrogenase maturation protease